ncbi:MAG: hypothetical protein Q7U06_01960, partial [Pseudomonadota bacterium]|nr:hypothetical protein [Pseudomonadota bacterium]
MEDARALKRAYARLIREYGPETHPEVFQHIRRLYEQAGAARADAAIAEETSKGEGAASAGGSASAPSQEEHAAWVDAHLAAPGAPDLRAPD